MNLGWVGHVFSVEVRKLFSYRGDFWLSFVGSVFAELGVAYFLWRAIFNSQGLEQLGGFTLASMTLYYLFVPLVSRMVWGTGHGFLADEIYDGGLTRYLIYPLSYVGYKYVANLAFLAVAGLQLLGAVIVYAMIFGIPADVHLNVTSLVMGFVACVFGNALYFTIGSTLDLVAFWADNVWSLNVLLRLVSSLLGGGLIPLVLFPPRARVLVEASPFPYVLSFPIRCFLGQVGGWEFVHGITVSALWLAVVSMGTRALWVRGTKLYSGVGI